MKAAKTLVGKNLQKLRDSFGFDQDHVAEKIGVEVETVSRWENGKMMPSPEYLEKLLALYNLDNEMELLGKEMPETKGSAEVRARLIISITGRLASLNEKQLKLVDGFIDDLVRHSAVRTD